MRHGEDPVPDLEATQKQLLREVHHHMVNARSELYAPEASAEPELFNDAHSEAMKQLRCSGFSDFCSFMQRLVPEADWQLARPTVTVLPNEATLLHHWKCRLSDVYHGRLIDAVDIHCLQKKTAKLKGQMQQQIRHCIDETKRSAANFQNLARACRACLESSQDAWQKIVKELKTEVGLPPPNIHLLSEVFAKLIARQSFEVVRQKAELQQSKAEEEAEKNRKGKEALRSWCLNSLCNGATDNDRAALMGKNLFESMQRHLNDDLLQKCVHQVAAAVQQKTKDPEEAVQRAFERHFGREDYMALCRYMLDPTEYLYQEHCADWLLQAREEASRVISTVTSFEHACNEMEELLQRPSSDIVGFAEMEEKLAASASHSAKVFLSAARLVPTAHANDPKLSSFCFTEAALKCLRDAFTKEKMAWAGSVHMNKQEIYDKVHNLMKERLIEDWNVIRGCSATCPICKAKCSHADPDHVHKQKTPHRCYRHMSSAFGGCCLHAEPDQPDWTVCCDSKVKDSRWVWGLSASRGTAHEMLEAAYPEWLNGGKQWPEDWCLDAAEAEKQREKYELAWVHIKEVVHLIYPHLSHSKCLQLENKHKFGPTQIIDHRRVTQAGALERHRRSIEKYIENV